MARNLTDQQEKFAQALASGMSQSDAYRHAYPTCLTWPETAVWSKSSQLARNALVVQRVADIRSPIVERVRERVVYNLQTAMDEALEAFEVSKANRQGGSMVAAAQLRAKLNALLVDRKEVSVTQMGNMTPTDKQELLDMAKAALEEKKRQVQLSDQTIDDVIPKS